MSPLEALVALNMLPGLGPIRCRRLIEFFGSAREALHAGRDACLRVRGIGSELAGVLARWQDHADPQTEIRECRSRGIRILTRDDECYPPLLGECYDPPLVLYCQGELLAKDHLAVGVVGSRRCSHYGIQTTRKLSYQLAAGGITIISGLARGIDTAAHEAALAAKGRTLAVIGSGLAPLYPAENQALAERLADGSGAVLSEYPLHTRPDKGTFPMRNRIIAAASQAVLVIECPLQSGALITANLAGEYGRPVYVVPGPVDRPSFAGSHRLIREGATLVTDGAEIREELGGYCIESTEAIIDETRTPSADDPEDLRVLSRLDSLETSIDELVERCGMPASQVARALLRLEISGRVQARPGARYVRR